MPRLDPDPLDEPRVVSRRARAVHPFETAISEGRRSRLAEAARYLLTLFAGIRPPPASIGEHGAQERHRFDVRPGVILSITAGRLQGSTVSEVLYDPTRSTTIR